MNPIPKRLSLTLSSKYFMSRFEWPDWFISLISMATPKVMASVFWDKKFQSFFLLQNNLHQWGPKSHWLTELKSLTCPLFKGSATPCNFLAVCNHGIAQHVEACHGLQRREPCSLLVRYVPFKKLNWKQKYTLKKWLCTIGCACTF